MNIFSKSDNDLFSCSVCSQTKNSRKKQQMKAMLTSKTVCNSLAQRLNFPPSLTYFLSGLVWSAPKTTKKGLKISLEVKFLAFVSFFCQSHVRPFLPYRTDL